MLTPVYKSVKARLAAQVAAIKDIQFYNRQEEGTIHAEPLALIEFPDELDIGSVSKTTDRALCTIRVRVISRVITDIDNTIPDAQVDAHSVITTAVITALKHHVLLSAATPLGSSLQHIGYRSVPDYKGWLVTWLTFTMKMVI